MLARSFLVYCYCLLKVGAYSGFATGHKNEKALHGLFWKKTGLHTGLAVMQADKKKAAKICRLLIIENEPCRLVFRYYRISTGSNAHSLWMVFDKRFDMAYPFFFQDFIYGN